MVAKCGRKKNMNPGGGCHQQETVIKCKFKSEIRRGLQALLKGVAEIRQYNE